MLEWEITSQIHYKTPITTSFFPRALRKGEAQTTTTPNKLTKENKNIFACGIFVSIQIQQSFFQIKT